MNVRRIIINSNYNNNVVTIFSLFNIYLSLISPHFLSLVSYFFPDNRTFNETLNIKKNMEQNFTLQMNALHTKNVAELLAIDLKARYGIYNML